MSTAISEIQVGATADDASNYGATHPGDGNFVANGTSLVLGGVGGTPINPRYYIAGLRFLAVPLAQGATIEAASLSFKCAVNSTENAEVYVAAEDADDAATFASTTHEPYDAYVACTTAVVDWLINSAWTLDNWYGGAGQTSACELKDIVQEIVNRAGWATGQNLVFVIWNKATILTIYTNPSRTVYAWDQTGNVSGVKFNCTYASAGGSVSFSIPLYMSSVLSPFG